MEHYHHYYHQRHQQQNNNSQNGNSIDQDNVCHSQSDYHCATGDTSLPPFTPWSPSTEPGNGKSAALPILSLIEYRNCPASFQTSTTNAHNKSRKRRFYKCSKNVKFKKKYSTWSNEMKPDGAIIANISRNNSSVLHRILFWLNLNYYQRHRCLNGNGNVDSTSGIATTGNVKQFIKSLAVCLPQQCSTQQSTHYFLQILLSYFFTILFFLALGKLNKTSISVSIYY